MLSVLFIIIIYLFTFFFSSPYVELFKRHPLALPLFLSLSVSSLHSSLRWEAKLTCIVDPSRMFKYSAGIHLPCFCPCSSRDKIKRETERKFAALDHDLREKVEKFYFHIFSDMVCVMEDKKQTNKKTSKYCQIFLKKTNKQTQNNSLDVICFCTSFI